MAERADAYSWLIVIIIIIIIIIITILLLLLLLLLSLLVLQVTHACWERPKKKPIKK